MYEHLSCYLDYSSQIALSTVESEYVSLSMAMHDLSPFKMTDSIHF